MRIKTRTMHKPVISIKDFTYTLPDERIAKYPLEKRDFSKLLVYKNEQITDSKFINLIDELPENSMLVFNNTKVIQARLKFTKETGAEIELFCLEPLVPSELQLAFETNQETSWKCIIGNARKWKQNPLIKELIINDQRIQVEAFKGELLGDAYKVDFKWNNDQVCFSEIIEAFGLIPIPPYLNRNSEEIDSNRYQTVYSEHKGSVAAPTAGLHFTNDVLKNIKKHHHKIVNITLHVGAGTFKPVKSETIDGHEMHTEHFVIEKEALQNIINHKNKIIAIGTTSVRTLESLYWYGVRLLNNHGITEGISQWDPYNLPGEHSKEEALEALLNHMQNKNLKVLSGKTSIIIVPGYQFRIINGLVTNFHQPQSTLLLLISAIVGNKWKEIYQFALDNDYRFLSYGDSSLLINND